MKNPSLDKIMADNLDKTRYAKSNALPSLPTNKWLDKYTSGGIYLSDKAKATQFGQYAVGGSSWMLTNPNRISTYFPRMNNGGGLLSRTVTCSDCGWSWKAVDGGKDVMTCHKCGGMIKMKKGGSTTQTTTMAPATQDSVRHLAGQMMNFEATKGSPSGGGLSDWGYHSSQLPYNQVSPNWHPPQTKDEAVNLYMQEIGNNPTLGYFNSAMEKGEAGDFLYNTGRDPRVYMLDQYLKSTGQAGLPNRGSYNVDTKTAQWTPELQGSLDQQWNQYSGQINKLPTNTRRQLLNKGRDFYYQNINKQPDGSPNPAYEATWKPRIWESVNTYKKNGGDISIPNLREGNWLNKYDVGGFTVTDETTKPQTKCKDGYGCHGNSSTQSGEGIKKVGVRDQPEPQGNGENYVALSNAPTTWEELQTYNETNPKDKDFKNRLKFLQGQFTGLTQQQLLAAGADSFRIRQRMGNLPRYDQPSEQTYDRAYHNFYRPLMNQSTPVTIPQILQFQSQQPGGLQGYEGTVRGNYGRPKAQDGLNIPGVTDFKMPLNRTDAPGLSIQEKQKQDAAALEIQRRNDATAKRQFVGKGKASTKESEARRVMLNKQNTADLPNVQMDQFGNTSAINPNMTYTGEPANFMGERQQKGYEHIMGGLEAAGYATGAGELAELGYGALKKGIAESMESGILSKIDKKIYPTRAYRVEAPGGNITGYESSDLSKKIFDKGDFATKDLTESFEYLRGTEAMGGKPGLVTGQDMNFTEYKVPFWKKNVSFDSDVAALKKIQGVDVNANEYIIPKNKLLYPRKTTTIKAVPEHIKTAETTLPSGLTTKFYNPSSIPLSPRNVDYASPTYKYIEDQMNAVTGHRMPITYEFDQSLGMKQNLPILNWKQPQFPQFQGVGNFKQGGVTGDPSITNLDADKWLMKYQQQGQVVNNFGLVNPRDLARQNMGSGESTSLGAKIDEALVRQGSIDRQRRNQGQFTQAQPNRSGASKAWAIATHPMTALAYKAKGQDIPEHFEKGETNPYEHALNVINPAGYIDAGASIPGNIARGEFLQAGLDAATVLPMLSELRGLTPEIKAAINSSKESGVLSKTYKINPWAFKSNPEAYYRGIGKGGYEDVIQSGVLRQAGYETGVPKYKQVWYGTGNKGFARAKGFADNYIVEVPETAFSNASLDKFAGSPGMQTRGTLEHIPIEKAKIVKKDWLRGYKEVPKPTSLSSSVENVKPNLNSQVNKEAVDFSKYLTQEEAVKSKAERMLAQENKWVDQPSTLRNKFETANSRHNPASEHYAETLGRNTGEGTEISVHTNMSPANKARVAAHEVGHYYRPKRKEGDVWNSFFDWSKLKGATANSTPRDIRMSKEYLSGKGYYKRSSTQFGDEIRERAGQLKDYIAQKNRIPASKNFEVTTEQLDDAILNYTKDTGLDNNMSQMLGTLKDKKGFLEAMNKYALGTISAVAGAAALQQKKKGGVIKDDRGQWDHPGEITEIGSNRITMQGVPYPVLGISDTGDQQMMYPGEEYKFKGKKVTEFPMAQDGKTLPPIYTDDLKKIKKYKDSLAFYNKGVIDKENFDNLLKSNNLNESRVRTSKASYPIEGKIQPISISSIDELGGGYDYNKKDFTTYLENNGAGKRIYEDTELFKNLVKGYNTYKNPQPYIYKKPDPTLNRKPVAVQPIPFNKQSSISGLRTMEQPNIELPAVQRGQYRTSYYDSQMKDWNERAFMSQQESDQFANEMSQRGYPGSYGNVTQKTQYKNGGWLSKYQYAGQTDPIYYNVSMAPLSDNSGVRINTKQGPKDLVSTASTVSGLYGAVNAQPKQEGKGETIINTTGKFLDPTGISSWGDAGESIGNAIDNPGILNTLNATISTLGALPFIHYLGATGKVLTNTNKVTQQAVNLNKLQKAKKYALQTAHFVSGQPVMNVVDKITRASKVMPDANKLLTGINKSNRFWQGFQGYTNAASIPNQKYGGQNNWLNNYK